jgi:hypothetical protein
LKKSQSSVSPYLTYACQIIFTQKFPCPKIIELSQVVSFFGGARSSGVITSPTMQHKDDFGRAPTDMRICPRCFIGEMTTGRIVNPAPKEIEKYKAWCSKARCPICAFEWYICRSCTNIRTTIDCKIRLRNHAYKYHKANVNSPNDPNHQGGTAVARPKRKRATPKHRKKGKQKKIGVPGKKSL